jgi:hypothetical protein
VYSLPKETKEKDISGNGPMGNFLEIIKVQQT